MEKRVPVMYILKEVKFANNENNWIELKLDWINSLQQ